MEESHSLYTRISNSKNKAKTVYNIVNTQQTNMLEHYYQLFYKKVELELDEYLQAFINLRIVTDITKFRDFQYRLLTNNIYTNNILFYWKKTKSKVCDFCKKLDQTVPHMLIECEVVQKIWQEFKTFCNKCINTNMSILRFQKKEIMLNLVHPKPCNVVNFMALIIKQYLFYSKCNQSIPLFREAIARIEMIYKIEKASVLRDNKGFKKFEKWSEYETGNECKEINLEYDYIREYIDQM